MNFVETKDTKMVDHKTAWLYHHAENITGALMAAAVATTTNLTNILTTLGETALVSLVSGALGAIAAHYAKKLIKKIENKNGEKTN